ncbi:potassium channel family protein [Pseudodesulfovibrio sp.]|uniref:potassium channel family protein n=1 Tax=unclassified Pseudodesulfovibrio TaxID=2661612 RepID=UPI003AFFAC51
MAKKNEIGIIGLGKFGFSLGSALTNLGHDVVGVDLDAEHIRRAQDKLSHVYQADATDEKALEQVGIKELDRVVVSTGESMEASILCVLNLQSLGVENIWVKAISEEHERVLYKIGVPYVVFPEAFVAFQLAHRLATPGIQDYFGMGQDVVTREILISKWAGKTLRDLNLTNEYHVQVVAYRKNGEAQFTFVPEATRPFEQGDVVVLIGKTADVMKIDKF